MGLRTTPEIEFKGSPETTDLELISYREEAQEEETFKGETETYARALRDWNISI